MSEPRDNYTVIPGWTKRLGLTLTEKVVYCVIYGFSQDEDSTFHGSRAYLASVAACTTKTIDRVLKKLLAMGLIRKRDVFRQGVKFCEYVANVPTGDIMSGGGTFCPKGRDIMSHNNIEDNETNKFVSNRESSAPARVKSNFDFKKALLDMGVTEQHAADWMAVRKAKRMTNTRTAFDRLKAQIEKACRQYGVTPDDCVALAASKDWGGFDHSWEGLKDLTTTTTNDQDDRVRRAYAAAEAKFRGGVHF